MGQKRIQNAQSRDINVRPARLDERRAVHHVYYRAVHEGAKRYYSKAQCDAWAPSREPKADTFDPNGTLVRWVAEHNGDIVGFMALEPDGYLDLAFVLPEWMGRGVAQALYDQLLTWARQQGLTTLTTHASHLARPFFMRQGWSVDAPEIHAHNGQRFERFVMSLELD